jgi:NADH-quinone oxidoreductase subunit E
MEQTQMQRKPSELLSAQLCQEIDRWLEKYPLSQRRSAILPALTLAQDANGGWLSFELIEAVAEYLGIPPIAAHEAATFYSMLELKPVGRHKLCVCTNISCMLLGSDDIAAHLGKKLGIGFGETTADGKFTLKEVECLGACGGAPMMMIGRTYYENLTSARVDKILADLE